MASYVNKKVVLGNAEEAIIPLNRWADADYSIQIELGTATIQGTLARENRGDTPVWATLKDSGGTALTLAAVGIHNVDFVPLEAIKVVAGVGGATVRVMQQGGD
jgi:hypothetical protein